MFLEVIVVYCFIRNCLNASNSLSMGMLCFSPCMNACSLAGMATGSWIICSTVSLNFAGCAVVVSHDRWFLDRICTHILSFEGDSNVVFYEGSYSEYEEYKRKQLGYEEPKRVRYRKLIE